MRSFAILLQIMRKIWIYFIKTIDFQTGFFAAQVAFVKQERLLSRG
jgi:hypothetical protein